ncbi:MAG: FHA domain-containing protein [Elusimicrobiota bacterium]|nr:FHA domain-containing protein [Elusimicrobiota bacterium]
MPKLLLKFNAAVIKEIPWDKDAITVGRKPDNDIVIDNPAISGHHCKLVKQGAGFFVEDLESTNGTFLNEKRVKTSGLKHHDVVGVAKHALVFVDDNPPPVPAAEAAAPAGDATMVLTPQKQAELAAASTAASKPEGPQKAGWLRILKGAVDATVEVELKGMSTYIGKSDRVQIQIKGSGLFGSAPEVAASIHRKPEGFVLVAVADGYPVVNGNKVSGSTLLKEGDIIDCGATTMQFELRG